jgi:hypothetical protein
VRFLRPRRIALISPTKRRGRRCSVDNSPLWCPHGYGISGLSWTCRSLAMGPAGSSGGGSEDEPKMMGALKSPPCTTEPWMVPPRMSLWTFVCTGLTSRALDDSRAARRERAVPNTDKARPAAATKAPITLANLSALSRPTAARYQLNAAAAATARTAPTNLRNHPDIRLLSRKQDLIAMWLSPQAQRILMTYARCGHGRTESQVREPPLRVQGHHRGDLYQRARLSFPYLPLKILTRCDI